MPCLNNMNRPKRQVVKASLSQDAVFRLYKIQQKYGLKTRSQALEMIIEQLLEDPDGTNPEPEG